MNSKWISVKADDGGEFGAYLSLPPTGRGPGIVLIQEIWGVNAHIRAMADLYAADGYVVLAPDIFWRLEPRVDLNYDEAGTAKAYELMQKMDRPKAGLDVATAATALRSRPEVGTKIASLGYCMGGFLAYLAATHGAVDAAVCYYGGGIQNSLDVAPKVRIPILFHYAEKDAHITKDAVESVRFAFASHNNARIETYPGVDHGFNCWGRPLYNQAAAALAHGRSLEWLAQHISAH